MVLITGLRLNRSQFLANCVEVADGSEACQVDDDHDLFRTEPVNLIYQRHELARLAELIDWQAFANEWTSSSSPPRVGLRCPRG